VRYSKVSHITTSVFLKRRELINIGFCTRVRCGTSPFLLGVTENELKLQNINPALNPELKFSELKPRKIKK